MYGGAKPGPAGARGPLPVSRILFNKHDKDGSGSISTAEFKDLAYSMGYFLSDQVTLSTKNSSNCNGKKKIL
jgi:Ca2+-binding EF-hand superfamily protein